MYFISHAHGTLKKYIYIYAYLQKQTEFPTSLRCFVFGVNPEGVPSTRRLFVFLGVFLGVFMGVVLRVSMLGLFSCIGSLLFHLFCSRCALSEIMHL